MQVKYRAADEDKRAEIQQQWKELIAKGEKMEPKLIEAAEKAYAESPNTDQEITDLPGEAAGQKSAARRLRAGRRESASC